ncbi:hypothetical protein GIB67_029384 [Kingdonia uniflora]|uniref:Mei2-like C-terminal RNA recognition motif domain-containing protein n=1 Tax=Kingdonia uniflora TaxID=39325 RepID=A0A7J7NXN1_9MAGN|nr:hypothetical protein GIB67_029384 [Kingdonia uniflora]
MCKFDFVYLPINFRTGLNLGYAFMNFTRSVETVRFFKCFQNLGWKSFNSRKVCEMKLARVQGKEGLVMYFENSYFWRETDEYLPVKFSPAARDGSLSCAFPARVTKNQKMSPNARPFSSSLQYNTKLLLSSPPCFPLPLPLPPSPVFELHPPFADHFVPLHTGLNLGYEFEYFSRNCDEAGIDVAAAQDKGGAGRIHRVSSYADFGQVGLGPKEDLATEAYEEFKHVLLALIYGKDDQTSPVANEWPVIRRFEIAGLLSSVLRAYLSAYDPIFSMTLRYLIRICLRQGISSPISDLTERLLLEERDPPPVPQESLHEAPSFDEVDIQALVHAVELTRQGDVDSLDFSKGNLFQAFQVVMGIRLGVNEPLLMNLMRATLHTHNEWFRLQMCKDHFEGLLKIDSLKEIKTPLIIDDVSKKNTGNSTPGSSQMTISSSNRMVEDGSSPTQVSSGDVICDETAILKVMNGIQEKSMAAVDKISNIVENSPHKIFIGGISEALSSNMVSSSLILKY